MLLSCIIFNFRQLQITGTTFCISFISLTRLFANFCTDRYLRINHGLYGDISVGLIGLLKATPHCWWLLVQNKTEKRRNLHTELPESFTYSLPYLLTYPQP